MAVSSYKEAKSKFLSYDYSVMDYFRENGFWLEYGYSKLFTGNIEEAEKIFKQIQSSDLRADWAIKLISFIKGYVPEIPSYFQIRNFLEIDLNFLIHAKQPQFVENIINGADLFYEANPESYKFIARVMINNEFYDVAFYFLNKAKNKFYYDPEMHLMLAACYIKRNEMFLARQSLKTCLRILPNYFPAKRLLDKIN